MLYDTILDLEDQTWRALQTEGAALLPFLSTDCVMLFPMGMKISFKSEPSLTDVMGSKAFIPWKNYRISEAQVIPLGTEAATISYRVKAIRTPAGLDDDGEPFLALISSTWKRDTEANKWLMCFHQQTPYVETGL